MKKLYLILLFFSSLSASGQIRLNQFTKGKQITEQDEWTIPYNPIELE